MRQAIVKKGKIFCEQVSAPIVSKGSLLIKVVNSCISAGTEISSVCSSGRSLIKRALQQPKNVKKVLNLVRSNGIAKTYTKVKNKLYSGSPTGYSVSGVVIAIGEGVDNFAVGDCVAAGGAGLANHAEYVDVPVNLVVKLPAGMDFKAASTVALGAIAMQGIRRVDLHIGEFCVVTGAGILGLLSVEMLRLAGVRVAALDLDDHRLDIARQLGAEVVCKSNQDDPIELVQNWTGGYGADAVLFTAATNSSEPLSQAFQMCRKKGKVVLVGASGMEIKRADIYAKELDFQISTSYGPGRYDTNYEEHGLDYPYAYVRWTEGRNMTEYLRLVHNGSINLEPLIDTVYPIEQVTEAFESLQNAGQKPLMILLDYGKVDLKELEKYSSHERKVVVNSRPVSRKVVNVALVGAGNFATAMHIPNIEKLKDKYHLHAVVNHGGYKAKTVTREELAGYATTDYEDVLKDHDVDMVLIATRHDSHAELTLKALQAGKHVFVEKPLATTQNDLDQINSFYDDAEKNSEVPPVLFTGFNRRFSRYATEIKRHTDRRINPLFISYRMNAGFIPQDHWVHENGGRIVGEACHIIDLMTFFIGSRIASICVESFSPANDKFSTNDNRSIILKYQDGSVASVDYFAVGSKSFPKEYMEVHFDGKTIALDDYKSLKGYGVQVQEINTPTSEKGHLEELEQLYEALEGNRQWPIELWDMVQTTQATLVIVK